MGKMQVRSYNACLIIIRRIICIIACHQRSYVQPHQIKIKTTKNIKQNWDANKLLTQAVDNRNIKSDNIISSKSTKLETLLKACSTMQWLTYPEFWHYFEKAWKITLECNFDRTTDYVRLFQYVLNHRLPFYYTLNTIYHKWRKFPLQSSVIASL